MLEVRLYLAEYIYHSLHGEELWVSSKSPSHSIYNLLYSINFSKLSSKICLFAILLSGFHLVQAFLWIMFVEFHIKESFWY